MSNNTSKQKSAAIAMVGVLVAGALVAAISFAPIEASAQERAERGEVERQHRLKTASGSGVATDIQTGEDYRSGFRAIWHNDNSTDERVMLRGVIVISEEGERVTYSLLPDTWKIESSENGLTFEASGQVQKEGRVFDVTLNGYIGGPVAFVKRIGTTWSVDGVMSGEEREYELHYVIIAPLGRPVTTEE